MIDHLPAPPEGCTWRVSWTYRASAQIGLSLIGPPRAQKQTWWERTRRRPVRHVSGVIDHRAKKFDVDWGDDKIPPLLEDMAFDMLAVIKQQQKRAAQRAHLRSLLGPSLADNFEPAEEIR